MTSSLAPTSISVRVAAKFVFLWFLLEETMPAETQKQRVLRLVACDHFLSLSIKGFVVTQTRVKISERDDL